MEQVDAPAPLAVSSDSRVGQMAGVIRHPCKGLHSRKKIEFKSMEKLLNAAQVAECLSVAKSTIRKWVHYGYIPHVHLGRAVRFRERDIEQWVQERTEKGRATLAPEIQWQ
jgi:excisionase family DNA binding protein